jgi:F0F1-type ATP synthase membrane subunit b/b'
VVFQDENFYIAISFCALVAGGYFGYRRKIVSLFKKRIRLISKSINNAACAKEQSLLEFTRVNTAVAKLPDNIVNIWQEYNVDQEALHAQLEQELLQIEQANAVKLVNVEQMALKKEYEELVRGAAKKFKDDVVAASDEQKSRILTQSIHLLSTISLDDSLVRV